MRGYYERVSDFNNLYEAHRQARRCKRHKRDVIVFEMDLANNLWRIKERLESGTYKVGSYHRFMIRDPKDREIQALRYADRVVQHSLCDNVLSPFFEKRLIHDNCACRAGKGTHFGIDRRFLREHYRSHGGGRMDIESGHTEILSVRQPRCIAGTAAQSNT